MSKTEGRATDLRVDAQLPKITNRITQQVINTYAQASRDFNPIHIDEQYAAKTPAGGTIAHGMLVLAYVSQMMTSAFGMDWVCGGSLDIRFKAPARPGDRLTVSGKIVRIEESDAGTSVHCDITCANQKDDIVVLGNAEVTINND